MAELPAEWIQLVASPAAAPLSLLTPPPARQAPLPALSAVPPGVAAGLRRITRPAVAANEADRRAKYMATLSEPSLQGSNGSAVLMKAAFHAKEMSRDEDDAAGALAEWNVRLATPPWSEGDLRRAIRNSAASFGTGLDREQASSTQVASAAQGGTASAGAPASADPAAADVAWVESMQAYVTRDRKTRVWNLANPLTEKAAVGALVARGVSANAARALLKNWEVTLAARVDCDPTQPPTFEVDGQVVLNNYIPGAIAPAAGFFPVLEEVLTFLTASDPSARAWLVNWLAFAYQNPARPMRTVPVIFGAQRTGKSLLARAMATLLGDANCAVVRNEDIKGRFTSHFVTKLFVTVGEIEAGEVNHATSTLKYLTGEPTLVFEAKGSSAFPVVNRIKMLATSNQTLPVSVEGEADSRWVLFKQLDRPTPEYAARMDSLFDQSNNEWSAAGKVELAALAAHLLAHPVDAVLARSVHVNDARAAAVEASRSSVEQFVDAVTGSSLDAVWLAYVPEYERASAPFDHMDFDGHEELTGTTAVYATYRSFCKASGLQPLGMGRFPGELERHAAHWQRRKVSGSVVATRPWAYVGVPRAKRLRLQYLPLALRQQTLLPSPTNATSPGSTPPSEVRAKAIAVMQQTFGIDPEEETP